jgi:aminoglycoside phosphotransferase (APT) family kinase protein
MHAVDVVTAQGERLRLVVRRYTPQQAAGDPDVCRREWQTLRALQRAGAPAPRPVFLDDDGIIFGTPTLVMTRLPGHAFVAVPTAIEPWLEQFASVLAAIHAAVPTGLGASNLRTYTGREIAARLVPGEETDRRVTALQHGQETLRALRARWPPAFPEPPVLVHGDFFTGNTVWLRNRLSGVVDWGDAVLGPREVDLCTARLDLAILSGPAVADRFLVIYEPASGRRATDMALWDLAMVWGGVLFLDHWWEALHDVGASIDRSELGARFDAFAQSTLDRL